MTVGRLLVTSVLVSTVFLAVGNLRLAAQAPVVTHRVSATVRPFARWVIIPSAAGGPPKLTLFTNDPALRVLGDPSGSLVGPDPAELPTLGPCLAGSSCTAREVPRLVLLTIATP